MSLSDLLVVRVHQVALRKVADPDLGRSDLQAVVDTVRSSRAQLCYGKERTYKETVRRALSGEVALALDTVGNDASDR